MKRELERVEAVAGILSRLQSVCGVETMQRAFERLWSQGAGEASDPWDLRAQVLPAMRVKIHADITEDPSYDEDGGADGACQTLPAELTLVITREQLPKIVRECSSQFGDDDDDSTGIGRVRMHVNANVYVEWPIDSSTLGTSDLLPAPAGLATAARETMEEQGESPERVREVLLACGIEETKP